MRRCVYLDGKNVHNMNLTLYPVEEKHSLYTIAPPHMVDIFSKKDNKECPICLLEIKQYLVMTKCFHFFHKNCMDAIIDRSCPCCRTSL